MKEEKKPGLLEMLFKNGELPSVNVEIDTVSIVKVFSGLALAGLVMLLFWFILKKSLKSG